MGEGGSAQPPVLSDLDVECPASFVGSQRVLLTSELMLLWGTMTGGFVANRATFACLESI